MTGTRDTRPDSEGEEDVRMERGGGSSGPMLVWKAELEGTVKDREH